MSVSAYTGPMNPEVYEHAKANIVAFLAGLKARGFTAIAVLTNDSVDEKFIYRVSRRTEHAVLVELPGVPLERIRPDDEASGGLFEELKIDGDRLS